MFTMGRSAVYICVGDQSFSLLAHDNSFSCLVVLTSKKHKDNQTFDITK